MENKKTYGKDIDTALNTWIKLSRAYSQMFNLTHDNIRTFNLTVPQFGVIEVLGHLGPLRVGQLCDKMLSSGGNMTLVLDNLEKDNLIERIFAKEDRRAINVKLTEKGEELFNRIFIKHAEFIQEQMNVLSNDELTKLGDLLKKLGLGLKEK